MKKLMQSINLCRDFLLIERYEVSARGKFSVSGYGSIVAVAKKLYTGDRRRYYAAERSLE